MRKFLVVLTAHFLFSFSSSAQINQTASQTKTTVSKEFIGHWQKGAFSLTSFEQNDGKYIGPANETSVSYVINSNGTAREYFIYNTNTYNCRMQILGFREGALIMNTTENSFEFRPTSGWYSSLSCASKSSAKKPYGAQDLYPAYSVTCHLEKDADGSPVLIAKKSNSTSGLPLNKIN